MEALARVVAAGCRRGHAARWRPSNCVVTVYSILSCVNSLSGRFEKKNNTRRTERAKMKKKRGGALYSRRIPTKIVNLPQHTVPSCVEKRSSFGRPQKNILRNRLVGREPYECFRGQTFKVVIYDKRGC